MTSRARWIILGLALAGLGFATASAYVHYRVLTDPTYISPCDLSRTFNCTQVYLSRFGSIRGVPVALGGVIWFALVALLTAFSRPAPRRDADAPEGADPIGGYIFALATIGLSAILYLAYASFFILKNGCVLCIGTYVCVIGIFIVSGLTTSTTMTRLPVRLLSDLRALVRRPVTLLVAILYIAGAASVVAFFPKEGRPQTTAPAAPLANDVQQQFEAAWAAQPRVDFGFPPSAAKVVIVKFNDWLCPGCKGFNDAYKPILEKYEKSNPGAVTTIVMDWPWSTSCNFSIQATIHGHEASCEAAAAVRMARDRGKGDEMGKWLFDNQERLVEMDLKGSGAPEAIKGALTTVAGITDFDKQYPAKVLDIKRDIANGAKLQVHTTPTFFVNGVRTTDPNTLANLPPQYLDLAIQIELKKVAGK